MRLLLSALPLILLPLSALAADHGHAHRHDPAHAPATESTAADTPMAASLGSHQHGIAQLDVVLDAGELLIDWHTPAANLLGFEHAPRSTAEQQALWQLRETLQEGATLFALPAAAQCTPHAAELSSRLFDSAAHTQHDDHHDGHAQAAPAQGTSEAGEHSDIHARYRFTCRQPAVLDGLALDGLFQRFAGLERLQVQLIGPSGQQGLTLDGRHSRLRF